ncbi:MAG: nitroreductase family protein [Candidatus Omnitrophota bacterium]|nr:nitroreductase family protein [Candidatus Omnitrophota bacterium]
MNEIMAHIKNRRSRRSFLDTKIPDETVEKIIEAGRYAPSALNKQPWKFIVIANKDSIKKLSGIVKSITAKILKLLPVLKILKKELRNRQIIGALQKTISDDADTVFYSAPLLILLVSDKNAGPYASRDCALASQNMMLYAHSLEIGSCFIGRADFLMRSGEAKDIIGLPPRHKIQAAVVFGRAPHENHAPAAPARKKDNIINWVR